MMNKKCFWVVLGVLLLGFGINLSAQNESAKSVKPICSIGFRTGVTFDIMQASSRQMDYYTAISPSVTNESGIPMELNFTIEFPNRISLQTGFAYKEYKPWFPHSMKGAGNRYSQVSGNLYYKSLQIPLRANYNFYLGDSWNLFAGLGLVFDIPVYQGDAGMLFLDEDTTAYFEEYYIGDDRYWLAYHLESSFSDAKFNILAESNIGISYTFCRHWQMYFMASYCSGLRNMGETSLYYRTFHVNKETNNPQDKEACFTDKLLYKGDYWMIGFGMKYLLDL